MHTKLTNALIALTNRNYKLFFCGQMISLCGTWMQMLAMSWLAYRLTGSPALMGLVMFFTQAPSLILSPIAGALADRKNKRKGLIVIQSAFCMQTLILAILTMSNHINIPTILLLALIQGLITSFDFPFRQSMIPDMLEHPEHLQNAIALNSLIVNTARIIGPSLAGIIVASLGEGWCFLLNSFSYIGVIIALFFINTQYNKPPRKHKISTRDSVLSGFKYVWTHNSIRAVMAMLFVASFIGTSYMTLLPMLVKDTLNGSSVDMGFLMAAAGVGAIIGATYLALRTHQRGLEQLIGLSVGVAGIAFVALGNCNVLFFAYFIMPVVGLTITFQMASSNTFVQATTESNMRGRVMGIYALLWNGISPFGNLLYGFAAEFIGSQMTIAAGGIVMILSAIIYFLLHPPEKSASILK